MVFYICRSCDRGQGYHNDICRHRARLIQRRKANHKYQASHAAKLDHADRQRAYMQRRRLKPKNVTGQGSETAGSSVTIASSREPEPKAQPGALYANRHSFPATQQASSGLVFCIVCGRLASLSASMPRSP
jgi:hypothetical protein